jgi:hypothetical protein
MQFYISVKDNRAHVGLYLAREYLLPHTYSWPGTYLNTGTDLRFYVLNLDYSCILAPKKKSEEKKWRGE